MQNLANSLSYWRKILSPLCILSCTSMSMLSRTFAFATFLLLGVLFTKAEELEDAYHPKQVELRPWTNTGAGGGGVLEKRVPLHFMEMTHRDFMDNCDGQCFYHKGDPKAPGQSSCDPQKRDCLLAVSIARHSTAAQCSFVGLALGAMNATICDANSPDKQFYSVSIIRHVANYSCGKHPYLYDIHMTCLPTEFVAISFYPEGHSSALDDSDKWFVCVAGEHWISYWESVTSSPNQIKATTPYNNSAPGVIDYRTKYDAPTKSFVCKFIISGEDLNKFPETPVQFPTSSSSSGSTVRIKVAQGRILRKFLHRSRIPASFAIYKAHHKNLHQIFKTEITRALELRYLMAQQNVDKPVFVAEGGGEDGDEGETIFAETFEGPSPNTIDFEGLAVTLKSVHVSHSEEEQKEDAAAIEDQYTRCSGEKELGKLKCFHPNHEKGCMTRQRCKVLLLLEEVGNVLQATLLSYSSTPETTSKTVKRPRGWTGVAFSKDFSMGQDLVVACTYNDDQDINIVVSYNGKHHNHYDKGLNQKLIFDKEVLRYTRRRRGDTVLCRWKMGWKSVVDIGGYLDPPKAGDEVEFDFETFPGGMFILFASGAQVYKGNRISYHNYREVIEERFVPSRDVRGRNGGSRLTPMVGVILGIIVNFILGY